MKVLDAYPPNSPGKRPVCEGKVGPWTAEANERKEKLHGQRYLRSRRAGLKVPNDQCDFNARYFIDGKWLCRKHAAYTVLDALAHPLPEPTCTCEIDDGEFCPKHELTEEQRIRLRRI